MTAISAVSGVSHRRAIGKKGAGGGGEEHRG